MVNTVLLIILCVIGFGLGFLLSAFILIEKQKVERLLTLNTLMNTDINMIKKILADEFTHRSEELTDGKSFSPVNKSNNSPVQEEEEINFDYSTPFTFVDDVLSGKRDLNEKQ